MTWAQLEVEQRVRALPLPAALKEQLREELWGHLLALYDEALESGAAPEAARQQAVARLGSASTLATSFETAQPWRERIVSQAVLVLRHAQTPLGALGMAMGLFVHGSAFTLILSLAAAGLPGMDPPTALLTWITLSMLLVPAIAAVALAVHAYHAVLAHRKLTLRYVVVGGVITGVVAALVVLFGYFATEAVCLAYDRAELRYVAVVFVQEVFARVCLLPAVLGPVAGIVFAGRERRAQRLPDWPYDSFGPMADFGGAEHVS